MSVRDSESMTKMIHKIVASKNFGSIEEMQQFIKEQLERIEQGMEFYQEMLALNPMDNQGIRSDPLRVFTIQGSLPEVEVDAMAGFGGPPEAAIYAQQWCFIWYISGLPFLMLRGVSVGNPKKLTKIPHPVRELMDVIGQLDDLEFVGRLPWWEKFEKS
jgi:hypothetical protein